MRKKAKNRGKERARQWEFEKKVGQRDVRNKRREKDGNGEYHYWDILQK